uniref:PKD domain-containing protein n=1 Tax=Syphacia muris TaxID=451379 RepID=A0A0N5AC19_9BILA
IINGSSSSITSTSIIVFITTIFNISFNDRLLAPYAGPNQTVFLPIESVVLTGSVKDDGQIINYEWTQLSGPSTVKLINQDKVKCTAKGFQEGIFKFRLNVTDDGGLTAVSDTFVNVTRSQNEHPVARAENVTIYLPANLAVLNGSGSTDDAGIVRYLWTPHDDIPACIDILGDSLNKPELLLSDLVPGDFLFDLTVSDHSEAKNTTTVLLKVVASDEYLNSVEMFIKEYSANITYRLRDRLKARIVAAVVSRVSLTEASNIVVHFSHFAQEPSTGKLRVVFYVKYETDKKPCKLFFAIALAMNEMKKYYINICIYMFPHLVCSLDCSGHGSCSNFSKQCICDTYWMPNLFQYYLSGGSHDCSWSMLYFGIALVIICAVLSRLLWCVICRQGKIFGGWNDAKRVNIRRRKRRRFRRNDENTSTALANGSGKRNGQASSYSLLIGSDSLSSDTEIDQLKGIVSAEKRNVVDREEKPTSETELRERFSTISFD